MLTSHRQEFKRKGTMNWEQTDGVQVLVTELVEAHACRPHRARTDSGRRGTPGAKQVAGALEAAHQ